MKWRAHAATGDGADARWAETRLLAHGIRIYSTVCLIRVRGIGLRVCDHRSTYWRLQRPLLRFAGLGSTMDFREIAEASVAFGESTKCACNVNITTVEAMQHLATLSLVVFLRGDQSLVTMHLSEEIATS